MDRYVITASLKEIRSGTRSQWKLMSAGVMCSDSRILKISRAAINIAISTNILISLIHFCNMDDWERFEGMICSVVEER